MTDRIPLRGFYAGSDPTAIGEMQAGDTVPLANGGTGAATAADARVNLGVVWEKIYDGTPTTGLASIEVSWTAGRYRNVQILIDGVRPQVGSSTNDLYMRVRQGGVLKSGSTDYFRHDASWSATNGAVADLAESILRLTNGGIFSSAELVHANLNLFLGGTSLRGGLTGQVRWISNSAARSVAVIGHQVLVADTAIDGCLIGWIGGTGNDTFAATGRVQIIGQLVSSGGSGTPSTAYALKAGAEDIEITDATKGIILRSPDGSRWRVTIDNAGTLVRTKL